MLPSKIAQSKLELGTERVDTALETAEDESALTAECRARDIPGRPQYRGERDTG